MHYCAPRPSAAAARQILVWPRYNDHQIYSKVLCLRLCRFSRVSLIDKGDIVRAARDFLYGLRQLGHPLAVLLICRRDMQSQLMSQRIDFQMDF